MAKRDITENRIRRAVERSTPNMLPGILAAIDAKEAEISRQGSIPQDNAQPETASAHLPDSLAPEYKPMVRMRRRRRLAIGAAGMVAAVLIVVFGIQNISTNSVVDSIIELDVNPSIELTASKGGKVIEARALNADANEIIDGMDLGGVDLDVAMNALIGSMLKYGYLSELKNSILVSVENSDEQKARTLEKKLAGEIENLLSSDGVDGAVLTQTVTDMPEVNALADEYDISLGKAALINKLVQSDERLKFGNLVNLSINDLNLIAEGRKTKLQGINSTGKAAPGEYIGEGKAADIALSNAGVSVTDITMLETVMEYDDGMMIYDVDFYYEGKEYEYEIDAMTGKSISAESELNDDNDDDDD